MDELSERYRKSGNLALAFGIVLLCVVIAFASVPELRLYVERLFF